jgi:hypothetical protein
MNFSQALEALKHGEAVSNGNPIVDGYLLLYQMVDKSTGKMLIIHQLPGDTDKKVYELTQSDVLDNHWRILKQTEL